MRWNVGGDEQYAVERETIGGGARGEYVSAVGGVEGAAEEAEMHGCILVVRRVKFC